MATVGGCGATGYSGRGPHGWAAAASSSCRGPPWREQCPLRHRTSPPPSVTPNTPSSRPCACAPQCALSPSASFPQVRLPAISHNSVVLLGQQGTKPRVAQRLFARGVTHSEGMDSAEVAEVALLKALDELQVKTRGRDTGLHRRVGGSGYGASRRRVSPPLTLLSSTSSPSRSSPFWTSASSPPPPRTSSCTCFLPSHGRPPSSSRASRRSWPD